MTQTPYEKVGAFHQTFDSPAQKTPHALSKEQTLHRAGFKIEELVELLYATADNDSQQFEALVAGLHQKIDDAVQKIQRKNQSVDDVLVGQVDAYIDLLYFTYGSFVLMGVNPEPLFDIVHEANMGKLFPDGKPHYDEHTHKVLKPSDWEEHYAPEPKIKAELLKQKQNVEEDNEFSKFS